MRINFDFNIEWFSGGMLIAIVSAVGGGLGFQGADVVAQEAPYLSKGLALGTIFFIIWTAKCSWYWLSKMFSIHWNRS